MTSLIGWFRYQYIRKTNFLKWLHERRGKDADGFLLKDIQGSRMYLNTKDRGICYDLIVDGIREVNSTKFVKGLLKKGDVIVDLGANIGYYVLMESLLVGGSGKVYAIEPEPRNFAILQRNISINGRKNVRLFNMAIGDRKGVMDMHISKHSNMHTLHENRDSNSAAINHIIGRIKVKVITLDEFCSKNKLYPDFVRMDVQGYEKNIIHGMKKILSKKRPLTIFMELHPQLMKREETLDLLKTLKANGFKIIKMFKDYNTAMARFKDDIVWDYSIDDIVNDDGIMSGSLGTFELFFSRE